MSESDDKENTPTVKPETAVVTNSPPVTAADLHAIVGEFNSLVRCLIEQVQIANARPHSVLPAIMPNAWYTKSQAQYNIGMGDKTWNRLDDSGMTVHQPGTKEQLVHASNLDAVIRIPEDQLAPAYRSPFAEKNKARKKKGK